MDISHNGCTKTMMGAFAISLIFYNVIVVYDRFDYPEDEYFDVLRKKQSAKWSMES